MFPNWLNDLIVVDGANAHQFLVLSGEVAEHRNYQARNVASQTARVVCGHCNNGWMSHLEAAARPLLSPMIGNTKSRLTAAEQLLIARWAIKTAMVAESVQYGDDSFTREERELVRGGITIPIRPRVNLAAYDMSEINATRYIRGQGVVTRDGKFFAEIYAHTIQIGHLVLGVRGTPTFDALENNCLEAVAEPRVMEIPIWPPVGGNNLQPSQPPCTGPSTGTSSTRTASSPAAIRSGCRSANSQHRLP